MERNLILQKFIMRRLTDRAYIAGLIMLLLNIAGFIASTLISGDSSIEIFLACHIITAFYFIFLWANRYLRKGKRGSQFYVLFLLILVANAYTLNNLMTIFGSLAPWFCITVVVCSINYLAFPYLAVMPRFVRAGVFFLLGVSLCCYIYQAIYLLPLLPVVVIGFWILGLPLYAILPLLITVATIRQYHRYRGTVRLHRVAFWSGLSVSLLVIAIFVTWWSIDVAKLNRTYNEARYQIGIPAWVKVVQRLQPDPMMKIVLETSVRKRPVFQDYMGIQGSFFGVSSGTSSWNSLHDPLVLIAAFIYGTSDLSDDERMQVSDNLDAAEWEDPDRLWSGNDLFTTNVQTAVRIWPKLHIAYTEKTIGVENGSRGGRFNQEEAIYRFRLPEGAAVSSLSLWINGKEEKGVLTTKGKADKAYRTIVGKEARDPSVVHWQEGNTVSVRVFPVGPGLERQFKIGITSPLALEDGQLVYRNISFDGPSVSIANERVDISFDTPPAGLKQPGVYSVDAGKLVAIGRYRREWEISMSDEGLANSAFSYNGTSYTVSPYNKVLAGVGVSNVYLDVNRSWSREVFDKVFSAAGKNAHVWAYENDHLQEVTSANKDKLFNQLVTYRFSVFPFFEIKEPQTALVVTKGGMASPPFSTFEHTAFMDSLQTWLKESPEPMVFNLGGELNPYLRTLKEYGVFRYEEGTAGHLITLINQHQFPVSAADDQHMPIPDAGIVINSSVADMPSTTTDHLQRLFAYNHVMYSLGADQLTGAPVDSVLMEEAATANIVTPLSSLVVLEKKADYERFNIDQRKNTLKNAGMNDTGAVPEPHEWLLIITGILLLLYLKYRPSFSFKRAI